MNVQQRLAMLKVVKRVLDTRMTVKRKQLRLVPRNGNDEVESRSSRRQHDLAFLE